MTFTKVSNNLKSKLGVHLQNPIRICRILGQLPSQGDTSSAPSLLQDSCQDTTRITISSPSLPQTFDGMFSTQKNITQLFDQNSHALDSEEEINDSGEKEADGCGEKV